MYPLMNIAYSMYHYKVLFTLKLFEPIPDIVQREFPVRLSAFDQEIERTIPKMYC